MSNSCKSARYWPHHSRVSPLRHRVFSLSRIFQAFTSTQQVQQIKSRKKRTKLSKTGTLAFLTLRSSRFHVKGRVSDLLLSRSSTSTNQTRLPETKKFKSLNSHSSVKPIHQATEALSSMAEREANKLLASLRRQQRKLLPRRPPRSQLGVNVHRILARAKTRLRQ